MYQNVTLRYSSYNQFLRDNMHKIIELELKILLLFYFDSYNN